MKCLKLVELKFFVNMAQKNALFWIPIARILPFPVHDIRLPSAAGKSPEAASCALVHANKRDAVSAFEDTDREMERESMLLEDFSLSMKRPCAKYRKTNDSD